MPEPDPSRIVSAARNFIAVLKRHARQYDAPGNDTGHGAIAVCDAGRELFVALQGRTLDEMLFNPPGPAEEMPWDRGIYIGEWAMEAHRQCRIIMECLRRLLWRTGYRGAQRIEGKPYRDASYGTLPPMDGLEDLPQDGLPDLEHLLMATDELAALVERIGPPPPATGPALAPVTPAEPAAAGTGGEHRGDGQTGGEDAPASAPSPETLAKQIRRRWPRRKLQATLVDYMKDRRSASYAEVASNVHEDDLTDGGAIEQLVMRTNETLVELKESFQLRCGGEYVYKEPIES